MLSQNYGSNSKGFEGHTGLNAKMYHKKMFLDHIGRPFVKAFDGTFDYATAKLAVLLGGLPALLSLHLFNTPEAWWKGLLYLVLADWIGGIVNAIYREKFNWHTATRKWYQVTGYILVCGSAAVLSNGFPQIFYYFQFVVYATFFLKEFVSLLRTFRLLTMFTIVWEMIGSGKVNIHGFKEFRKEVDKRYNKEADAADKLR